MSKSIITAAALALAIAFAPCAFAAPAQPDKAPAVAMEQKAPKAIPLRDEKGRFVSAQKAAEAPKAPAKAAPLRDEKGRFVSTQKAPEAPKAPAAKAAPLRDEKGRFISTKNPEKSPVMVSAKKGSDVFHKPGCRYFDANAELKFPTPHDAEKAGLRACKVCGK